MMLLAKGEMVMSLNFLRKTVMSEPLFDDWDDFIGEVDG